MVDFSGHGISAALNAFQLQVLLQGIPATIMAAPSKVLKTMNQKLLGLLTRDQFATMFYAVLNTQKKQLRYAAAGSTHPAIIRNNRKIEWLDGTGLPLGASSKATYPTHTTAFQQKDALLLYSDALIETANTKGQYFTERNIESSLPTTSPETYYNSLVQRFMTHCNDGISDDLTVILLSH